MSDMKLIMEGWRSYSQDKKENTIFLLEHNRPYKVNFDLILEQKRLDESIKLWEESSNYELEKLLSEIDLMGKAKELTSKIGMKINEFIFKLSMQAFQLLQKGAKAVRRVVSLVKKITDTIKKYCKQMPTICKIAKISAMIITVFAISALFFSPEAQAAIQMGDQPLDADNYNFLRGVLMDYVKDADMEKAADFIEIVKELDQLQADPEVHQYKELANYLQGSLETSAKQYLEIADMMEAGDLSPGQAEKVIGWYRKLGETANASVEIIKGEGFMSGKLDFTSAAGSRPF